MIATFDQQRLPLLERAVMSACDQGPDVEVVVAVDHNPDLHRKVEEQFPAVRVVFSQGPLGASATRNAGARAAAGEMLAFLDDDAEAGPGWLSRLTAPLLTDPSVIGVAGWVEPDWATGRPAWFPMELGWVVGASYTGLPTRPGEVRNGWSENMVVRAADFWSAGGFREGFGKIGRASRPEDTDLCLRMTAMRPGARWWIEPAAVVRHHVPADRATLRFLWNRCRAEGAGKADLARLAGVGPGLDTERRYVATVLPRGVLIGVLDPLRGRVCGPLRSGAIVVGLFAAALGFVGSLTRRHRRDDGVSREPGPGRPQTSAIPVLDQPARIITVDLSERLEGVPEPVEDEPRGAICLVVLCGRPVGTVWVSAPTTATDLAERIDTELGAVARAEAVGHGLGTGRLTELGWPHQACPVVCRREALALNGPGVTVAVCTHARPAQLRRCLDSLDAVAYRNLHVLVVDNAPPDDATEKVCRDRPVGSRPLQYVREQAAGLSRARNLALSAVDDELVAFVDDDEVVDERWLSALVEEFVADPAVAAVTGLVLPADLSGMPQVRFERWGGHSKGRGFVRTVLDQDHQRANQPAVYPRPTFGAGANMAFRREVLVEIGGFDPLLGAGTPARGGEDTLALTEVMLTGRTLVYTPRAITWHFHRREEAALDDQLSGYARGLGAYYAALLTRDPSRVRPIARAAIRVARGAVRRRDTTQSGGAAAAAAVRPFRKGTALVFGSLGYAAAAMRQGRLR